MKLDLRWLILCLSSLIMQEGLTMLNFTLAPLDLYVYVPALFIGYSASFVPFKTGCISTILLGLSLEARAPTAGSLLALVSSFCILHYIQNQRPHKSRLFLRRSMQVINGCIWVFWLLLKGPTLASFIYHPLPLILSFVLSQGCLWILSLWYMDLQHRLLVPLQKRLRPSV